MKRLALPGALLVALFPAACGDAGDGPLAPDVPAFSSSGATLVECPVAETRSTTGVVGLLGGTISLDGHSISLPAGAVLLPTQIELTVPASNYMEIAIHANGLESFEFNAPVTVTLSYDRCTRSDIDQRTLTAWHIDEATKALLENMGGTDDKQARTVTFTSGHLSGFAIAN